MKKIYFLLCVLAIAGSSYAQTISNPGFETWRTSSSGSGPTVTIYAPVYWFGYDSLVINAEETYDGLLYTGYSPTNLNAQVFQDTVAAHVHSGSSSAKLITLIQDTLGLFPGTMSNAQPSLNISAVIGCMCFASNAIIYTGGTPTTERVTSVSAWVEYFTGKDSATGPLGGADTGSLTVQAISSVGGADSVVGTGTANIDSTSSFIQITANVVYVDTVDPVYEVRIIFASGSQTGSLDSSTLYVDDVTMVGIPQIPDTSTAVHNVPVSNDLVKVYPNPAAAVLYLDGPQNAGYTCELFSVNGQVVATKALTGMDVLDVSYLPAGMYFYSISDANGSKVQRGKVTVSR